MVMASLSDKLWSLNPLESLKHGNMNTHDPDHLYGNACLNFKASSHTADHHGQNWKLMIDPFIKGKSHTKVVRYGGKLDGPDQRPATVRDPRDSKMSSFTRPKEVDLKVPKFKYDKWSVGTPPLKSIFIYGLNDNVNQEFLTSLFEPLGHIEQLKVYYHPKTRKHLGIAFVSFSTSSVTQEVLAKYHGTSIMGNIVNIKPDPLCQITKKVLDKLIRGPVTNIPEIIQHVQLRSHHKTAAYAFRHNERSLNYYTARGKVRRPSDTVSTPRAEEVSRPEPVAQEELAPPTQHVLQLEQVSPKIDTPPDTEISPIRPEEDALVLEEQFILDRTKPNKRERPAETSDHEPYDLKYKVPKSELVSPPDRLEEKKRVARLYEMDKERRKAHSDRKYEEWKLRTELQIRTEKTNRYVKEHCSGSSRSDKYATSSDKYANGSDKYSKDYHLSERERYYAYYDNFYRESSKDHRYKDEKHRSKYDKYDKYNLEKYKYYDYNHRHSEYKRSSKDAVSYEKLHKLPKPAKDYEKYENVYHRSSPRTEHRDSSLMLSPHEFEKYRHSEASSERPRSKSRPRDEQYLVDRISKRKRSKSPTHHTTPAVVEPKKASPKIKLETSGSATSHDTGYASISPLPVSPPKPELLDPTQSDNPYGCARAVPRKHISKVKVIGLRSEVADMSSSSMSLDEEGTEEEEGEEEEEEEEKMRVEDISPNTTPQQTHPIPLLPLPIPVSVPLLPDPPASIPLLPLPPQLPSQPLPLPPPQPLLPAPPSLPVQYQAGQWLHTTYPNMYQYGYDYNPEEAADILARREAEEEAAAKQREIMLFRERRTNSLNLLVNLMENVLKRDIKIKLNEKVAFAQLEVVWNEEEDKKKKEEEELLAKKKEELASQDSTDQSTNKAPDMPSLSEMRSISDAKQTSHIRQTNLTFKVPKLNRGMRPQVIVKKMPLPQILDEKHLSDDDDVDEEDLVSKRKQIGSRYNTIYSSSSSSSESEEEEEEEEEEEAEVIEEKIESTTVQEIDVPPTPTLPAPAKYSHRMEEEEELILEQLFREDLFEEDKIIFKTAYDRLQSEYPELLEGVTWLSPPEIPNNTRRRQSSMDLRHRTGCARTEGFYSMSKEEKMALKLANLNKAGLEHLVQVPAPAQGKKVDGKTTARSTRATQRRQATHYFDIPDVQFLQLTTRRKMVKFQRSDIHDWGLFALEPISADEMVIEYVGEVVREIIANVRERRYEEEGIGSSYLFRIDQTSYIVDATHRGSISRFINHNCDPNCYARVISVGTKKKIVIYSKRDIGANEEITYDYKFAIEEEANKIPCLCNSPACRGFLN